MPEFFLELFSEEIPARMQKGGWQELSKICEHVLRDLNPRDARGYLFGPRRIAFTATIDSETGELFSELRGPKLGAPEAAIIGFARKNSASTENLEVENGYFVLRLNFPARAAADIITKDLPIAVAKLSWPKSMRWGQSNGFTWVRPLRRSVCLLDGQIIPITIGPITANGETEGHRFLSPGGIIVKSYKHWMESLRDAKVLVDATSRRANIREGLIATAKAHHLSIVEDDELLEEVSGLVEWPVPLIGRIDADFMDLPTEVRELSMKVNQRFFALRDSDGRPAPYFAFVSNIEAPDGGKAIIAGNERVLRARLSDARHFWDLDLKSPLNELLPKLDNIVFHGKIGTQGERVKRISALAGQIARSLLAGDEASHQAAFAGLLSKADLLTGMVGEFPELQGVIGGYYAERNAPTWNGAVVGPAIKTHYHPRGPRDPVPTGTVAVSVALADKLDTLIQFFKIGEKPTGSGDPFALRRAALGVIRIILENDLRLHLNDFFKNTTVENELFAFIIERLRVKLRGEGSRFDVLDSVLGAGTDDDLVRLMKRVDALSEMLETEDGKNLHAAYKRVANILKIEDAKGEVSSGPVDESLLIDPAEHEFRIAIGNVFHTLAYGFEDQPSPIATEQFEVAMRYLASLRGVTDGFFEKVTVNHSAPEIRQNRLRLLAQFRDTVNQIADFSKIEG